MELNNEQFNGLNILENEENFTPLEELVRSLSSSFADFERMLENDDDAIAAVSREWVVQTTDPIPPNMFKKINGCTNTDRFIVSQYKIPPRKVINTRSPLTPTDKCTQIDKLTQSFGLPGNLDVLPKEGRYGFKLILEPETKPPPKSCSLTYSQMLSCLYVKHDNLIPFRFQITEELPVKATEICCFLTFKEWSDQNDIVDRCPLHSRNDAVSGSKHIDHVVQVIRNSAKYTKCPQTGRYYTSFTPNVTTSYVREFKEILKFTCRSSCIGGINRRSIMAHFILYVNEKIEGHAVINIHISVCPGRGRINEEKRAMKRVDHPPSQPSFYRKIIEASESEDYSSTEKVTGRIIKLSDSSSDDDTNYYNVPLPKIKGIGNAKVLLRVLERMLPPAARKKVTLELLETSSRDKAIESSNLEKFEQMKESANVQSNSLKRSATDPISYRQRYKRLTVAVLSGYEDNEQ